MDRFDVFDATGAGDEQFLGEVVTRMALVEMAEKCLRIRRLEADLKSKAQGLMSRIARAERKLTRLHSEEEEVKEYCEQVKEFCKFSERTESEAASSSCGSSSSAPGFPLDLNLMLFFH